MFLDADNGFAAGIFRRTADAYAAISAEFIQFGVKTVRVDRFDRESRSIGFDYRQCRLGLFDQSQIGQLVKRGRLRWNIYFASVMRKLYMEAIKLIYPGIRDNLYCAQDHLQTFIILRRATSTFLMRYHGYTYCQYSSKATRKRSLWQGCVKEIRRVNRYLVILWGPRTSSSNFSVKWCYRWTRFRGCKSSRMAKPIPLRLFLRPNAAQPFMIAPFMNRLA
jgi:hypothetical protein